MRSSTRLQRHCTAPLSHVEHMPPCQDSASYCCCAPALPHRSALGTYHRAKTAQAAALPSCTECFAAPPSLRIQTHLQQCTVTPMACAEVSGGPLGCGAVAAEHLVRVARVKQSHQLLALGCVAAAAAADTGREVVWEGHQSVQPLPLCFIPSCMAAVLNVLAVLAVLTIAMSCMGVSCSCCAGVRAR
jgi:hypothetical protein